MMSVINRTDSAVFTVAFTPPAVEQTIVTSMQYSNHSVQSQNQCPWNMRLHNATARHAGAQRQ